MFHIQSFKKTETKELDPKCVKRNDSKSKVGLGKNVFYVTFMSHSIIRKKEMNSRTAIKPSGQKTKRRVSLS